MTLERAFLKVNGFNEVEMDRTKKLVGKIAGKHNIDQRYRGNPMSQTQASGFSRKKKTDEENEQDNEP